MSIVKVGWSGGKDSTCAVYKNIEQGNLVKATCYIPMFVHNIPLISKEHHAFIIRQAERFNELGCTVYFANGITYYDYCCSVSKTGIYKGRVKGYPYIGSCGFRRDSKAKALTSLDVGDFDYEDIGIAYDEPKRHSQLNEKKRSILCEKKITENDARLFCISKNALSPHYKYSMRDGCALCFNAKPIELQIWLNDYPQAREILIELQEKLKPLLKDRKNKFPLRRHNYFIETDYPQLSFV